MHPEKLLQALDWPNDEIFSDDTITNIIKEEVDIPCDFDDIMYDDASVITITNSQAMESNERKVLPLSPAKTDSEKSIGRTHRHQLTPAKSVRHTHDQVRNLPHFEISRKLGVRRKRRSSTGASGEPKKPRNRTSKDANDSQSIHSTEANPQYADSQGSETPTLCEVVGAGKDDAIKKIENLQTPQMNSAVTTSSPVFNGSIETPHNDEERPILFNYGIPHDENIQHPIIPEMYSPPDLNHESTDGLEQLGNDGNALAIARIEDHLEMTPVRAVKKYLNDSLAVENGELLSPPSLKTKSDEYDTCNNIKKNILRDEENPAEDSDPLKVTPAKVTQRQLSSSPTKDVRSPQSIGKKSVNSDHEYDSKCATIKKNIFKTAENVLPSTQKRKNVTTRRRGRPRKALQQPEPLEINLKGQTNENTLLSPLSTQKSINYDSEVERYNEDLKTNEVESPNFTFETIEMINEYINETTNSEVLSSILDSCSSSDPLASNTNKRKSKRLELKTKIYHKKPPKSSIKSKKCMIDREHEISDSEPEEDNISLTSDYESDFEGNASDILTQIATVDVDVDSKTIEKFKWLVVQEDEDVAPQHKLESRFTRPPPLGTKKLFVQHSVLKKGIYTPQEDEKIRENWKRFCKIHDWDTTSVTLFTQIKYRGTSLMSLDDRIRFVRFLAKGLPQRNLYSIYRRFQVLFSTTGDRSSIHYTRDEDKQILTLFKYELEDPEKCRKLAQALGRTKASIWARYKFLRLRKKGHTPESWSVAWHAELVEKFLSSLIDATLSDTIEDLKDELIPKIVWKKLEQKLGIPYRSLMHFWIDQLHIQLFSPRPISESEIKIKLIEYLYVKGFSHRKELIWSKIITYFEGVTSFYLCRLFNDMLQTIPSALEGDFAGMIDWLYEHKRNVIAERSQDRFIPRLSFVDGKLSLVDKELPHIIKPRKSKSYFQ